MEDNFFDLFHDGLKIVTSSCPVCNQRYNRVEAKIIDERDGVHLIHLRCRNCQVAILALVTISPTGVSSVGIVTDLTSEDVVTFKQRKSITDDDVIDMHQLLQTKRSVVEQLV